MQLARNLKAWSRDWVSLSWKSTRAHSAGQGSGVLQKSKSSPPERVHSIAIFRPCLGEHFYTFGREHKLGGGVRMSTWLPVLPLVLEGHQWLCDITKAVSQSTDILNWIFFISCELIGKPKTLILDRHHWRSQYCIIRLLLSCIHRREKNEILTTQCFCAWTADMAELTVGGCSHCNVWGLHFPFCSVAHRLDRCHPLYMTQKVVLGNTKNHCRAKVRAASLSEPLHLLENTLFD